MSTIQELRGTLDDRRARLQTIFQQAGPRMDMSLVTSLNGDSAAKVAAIGALNDEVDELAGQIKTLEVGNRLGAFDQIDRPPIHPTIGGAQRSRDLIRFGRVDGIGASFMQQMRAGLDGTSGGATMPASFFDPRLRDLPQRSLFVRSLIPTTLVQGSDKVDYVRQTVFTNNAAAVAANAEKPKSVITAERISTPIRVIAHVSEAMDRSLLSDYDILASFIDDQLRLGVLLAEETQILSGTGVAPQLTGILSTAGIQTQAKGADPTPDAIQKAMTKVRAQFAQPDAVVMHPNDWQDIVMLRTADGQYIWGHPADDSPPRIWGVPVVTSPVMTEGTTLVGAFGTGAEVYEREGARVSFSEMGLGDSAGQEMFTRNQVRFRGESRIGLAVIRPGNFCTVTGV